jgi:hypothetical protein
VHYELKAETLRFFTKPMATRLSDCVREVNEILKKYDCVITVNAAGQPQIVVKG